MKQRIQGIIIGVLITALLVGGIMTVTGASIVWKQIDVAYDNYKIYINGEEFKASDKNGVIEPFSYNGWIYAPFEHIAHALGMSCKWDGNTNSFYITSPKSATQTTTQPPTEAPKPQPTTEAFAQPTTQASKTDIKYYKDFPTVPDFGEFSGVNVKVKMSKMDGKDSNVGIGFYEPCSQNIIDNYIELLKNCGFVYYKSIDGDNYYKKDKIFVNAKTDDVFATISIIELK